MLNTLQPKYNINLRHILQTQRYSAHVSCHGINEESGSDKIMELEKIDKKNADA